MSAEVSIVRPCLRSIHNIPNLSQQPIRKYTSKPAPPTNAVEAPKVRRLYSRDFLLKFRYTASEFPPGVPTPSEIIEQYHAELALKDSIGAVQTTASIPDIVEPFPVTRAEVMPKIETAPKQFKLRLPSSFPTDNLSKKPMFTSSNNSSSRSSSKSSIVETQDKENIGKSLKQNIISFKKVKSSPTTPAKAISSVSSSLWPKVEPLPVTPVVTLHIPPPVVEIKLENLGTLMDTDDISCKFSSMLRETDPRRLEQRQKQIDYGKNTQGYQVYTTVIPKNKRRRENPKTPNKYQACSKRSWDGQIRKWRRSLHQWDPSGTSTPEEDFSKDTDELKDIEMKDAGEVAEPDSTIA